MTLLRPLQSDTNRFVNFALIVRGASSGITALHHKNIVDSLDSRPAHFPFSGNENRIHFPFPSGIKMLRITASRIHVWVTRRPAHTLKHTHNRVFVAANVPSDSFPHLPERNAYFFYDCFVFDQYTQTPFRKNNYPVCCSCFTTIFSPFLWRKSKKRKTKRTEAERIPIVRF